jgi:hypothetical protein
MPFHPDKRVILRTSLKKRLQESQYHIRGQILTVVESAQYLGVTLTNKLSWSNHITQITAKAKNSLSFLQRNIRSRPENIKALSYKALVLPQLECAQLCGAHTMHAT